MKNTNVKLTFLLALTGCAASPEAPQLPIASLPTLPKPISTMNLDTVFDEIQSLVSEVETQDCEAKLGKQNKATLALNAANFTVESTKPRSDALIKRSWVLRQDMLTRVKQLHQSSKLSQGCYESFRDSFRILRSIEDHLGELTKGPFPIRRKEPFSAAFSGSFPGVLTLDGAGSFDPNTQLKSGDVLISRGAAFTSAAIARLGDISSQFSHMAMIFVEPNSGQVFTIEAHIEVGVVVAPLEKYLGDGKVRSAIYRHKNTQRAALAAQIMFDSTKEASESGQNIPYDFKMDIKDREELHCSEVVNFGFELADPSAQRVPVFVNHFDRASRYFMSRLGIAVNESFVPGDIELDPEFSLIAEWRDFSGMTETRHKDAALLSIYEWMNNWGYEFQTSGMDDFIRGTVWTVRRIPLLGRLLDHRFPTNMPKESLRVILELDDTANALFDLAYVHESHFRQTFGLTPTIPFLVSQLEINRQMDLIRWSKERQKVAMTDVEKKKWGITLQNEQRSAPQDERFHIHEHFHPDEMN
jgi:hypothetical protein